MDTIDNFTLVQIIVYGVGVVGLLLSWGAFKKTDDKDKKSKKS